MAPCRSRAARCMALTTVRPVRASQRPSMVRRASGVWYTGAAAWYVPLQSTITVAQGLGERTAETRWRSQQRRRKRSSACVPVLLTPDAVGSGVEDVHAEKKALRSCLLHDQACTARRGYRIEPPDIDRDVAPQRGDRSALRARQSRIRVPSPIRGGVNSSPGRSFRRLERGMPPLVRSCAPARIGGMHARTHRHRTHCHRWS